MSRSNFQKQLDLFMYPCLSNIVMDYIRKEEKAISYKMKFRIVCLILHELLIYHPDDSFDIESMSHIPKNRSIPEIFRELRSDGFKDKVIDMLNR